ncbi:cytochrome b/b6 domain-containing protein [Rhizobium sp. FY34]|uniref:cytochrome b n=1 Tax=Rhizobium sp. FY34 TaxID=2562309 RepID=UPI0024848D89|nr:cytochrome b/b6 domain-containing protein [Rhizobium sp. FY34]
MVFRSYGLVSFPSGARGKSPEIAPWLSTLHEWSAWILFGLFALHIAGILFHHVLRRDDTLYRIV